MPSIPLQTTGLIFAEMQNLVDSLSVETPGLLANSLVTIYYERGHWNARSDEYFKEKSKAVSEDCKKCNENIHLLIFLPSFFTGRKLHAPPV